MTEPESFPYEVGKFKPPREHQFKPGNVPAGHRPRGSVGIARLLKEKFSEEIPGSNKTLAEALITKIATEALRNPIKYWPVLKAMMDREEPISTAEDPALQHRSPEDEVETQRRFEAFLDALPSDRRDMVIGLLLEVEDVIQNGSVNMGQKIREDGWGGGSNVANNGQRCLPEAGEEGSERA